MASSTSEPMAIAIPPRLMVFIVKPLSLIHIYVSAFPKAYLSELSALRSSLRIVQAGEIRFRESADVVAIDDKFVIDVYKRQVRWWMMPSWTWRMSTSVCTKTD